MTRAVRRAQAEGDPSRSPAAALASRPAPRRGSSSRDAGECWSLRLTPDERTTLGAELDALTDREREVALAICDGGSNEAVAERLYIALPTLRTHLMRINQKLGTRSKGDVVRLMVGRLLDGYRAGRIVRHPAGAGEPSANGVGVRLAEPKPLRPKHLENGSLGNDSPETGETYPRPGLARPKIIDSDDDSRIGLARMAGSL